MEEEQDKVRHVHGQGQGHDQNGQVWESQDEDGDMRERVWRKLGRRRQSEKSTSEGSRWTHRESLVLWTHRANVNTGEHTVSLAHVNTGEHTFSVACVITDEHTVSVAHVNTDEHRVSVTHVNTVEHIVSVLTYVNTLVCEAYVNTQSV